MKIEVKKLIAKKEYCEKVFNFFIKNKTIKETDQELFEKHLNKAINNLEFSNFILDEHQLSIKEKLPNKSFYDWSIIIYYYSIYHAISALIVKAGYESKNHLASISALTFIYYHKENILNKEDIEFIIRNIHLKEEEIEFIASSKNIRERASYRVDEDFDLLLATDLQKKTADFVNKVKNILKEVL